MDSPDLFTELIENWQEVGHHAALRLKAESTDADDAAVPDRAAADLLALPGVAGVQSAGPWRTVLPTVYRLSGVWRALFSTYAGLGSAEEVGLPGMMIELMFPADAAVEAPPLTPGMHAPPSPALAA